MKPDLIIKRIDKMTGNSSYIKRINKERLLLLTISFLFHINMIASERRVSFDNGWKFHRGSVANAEQPDFNDDKWRILDLPHDWSVEPAPVQKEGITVGAFSRLNEGGAGGLFPPERRRSRGRRCRADAWW